MTLNRQFVILLVFLLEGCATQEPMIRESSKGLTRQEIQQRNPVTCQPESVVKIAVRQDPSLNGSYVIDEDGCIDFGYVGTIRLQYLTRSQATTHIKNIFVPRYCPEADVAFMISKASYDQVKVVGSVASPGVIKITPGSSISLSDAVSRAGGITGYFGSLRIKIVRDGMRNPFREQATGQIVNLRKVNNTISMPDISLSGSDIVFVFLKKTPR